jgi:hypothetical protein
MITYTHPWPEVPALKVPVLHRVDYDYADTLSVFCHSDIKVRAWCKDNCQAAYYLHPGYTREKFVHFEDDQDAVFFALKWQK